MRCAVWFWGAGDAGSNVALRIAERLAAAHGAASTAMFLHADGPVAKAASSSGMAVFPVGGAAGHGARAALLGAAPVRAIRLLAALRRFRPRVVIVPMNFALACPLALVLRLSGCALVYVVHDATAHVGDFAPRWQSATQRWLIAHATVVVAMSAHEADILRSRVRGLGPDRLTVVPLHRLATSVRGGGRPAPTGPVRFLFLGRLLAYKGLDLLADALARLPADADYRLTIAGEGPLREEVSARFAAFPHVDLGRLRRLAGDEVDVLLETHDVMICPYRDASQSGSVVEAMYVGMPSLVTPVGALPEQVCDGAIGWVTRAATAEAIADALLGILSERAQVAAKSAATAAFARREVLEDAWPGIVARAAGGGRALGRHR